MQGPRADADAPRPLAQVIADETRHRRRRRWWWLGGSVVVLAAGVGIWFVARPRPAEMRERFVFETLTIGSVARDVVATGRVEPRGAVNVGAEISGRVIAVEVDYDDAVEVGQVLARFDPETLDAQVAQANASVASAKAALAQARVSLLEAERRELQAQTLHRQGIESHENYEAAKSAVELAQAQVELAQANVTAQRASAELVQTQASKAVIQSPIAGIVISRYIDPGQTVAAGFQTPVLFVIAEDLHRVEVITPIDEADIGEVALGQHASFTVDAYRDERFEAEVVELRHEAKIIQNVVTYDAVLAVDNPDLKLRPGMTASVRIETAREDDVLKLPTAALRFLPPGEQAHEGDGVWVLADGQLRFVPVELGVANGREAALRSGALEPGVEVITELSELGREAYGAPHSEPSKPASSSPHT